MKANIRAAFKDLKVNNKGEVSIVLNLKGDLSDDQILSLHKLKSIGVVYADLYSGQADIDDYEHDEETNEGQHEGLTYTVDASGNVSADADQVTLDDVLNEVQTAAKEAAASSDPWDLEDDLK